ncbi:hypothetical protein SAMN02745218_00263 [Desulfofundulus australicus DSM 11792]|uniref:Uncharacterized protein n=1 Tax=Desulfofundulus australicus DSM 11792 TaxID=1121425 RepID=A0A1M4T9V0_9FIRM|nr:hypothetical protein [Desulfofundulus australicus]SHE41286.1 hypothetical protein SAMN02745218_00263 [Desulfofundulus australicus DSM 11792]
MGLWELVDKVLILLYKICGHPVIDYFLGTFLLALLAVVVGEFTISLVFLVNKNHLDRLNIRLANLQQLTMLALKLGDKRSYDACNKEANDTFGRVFFNMVGLSAAALWPAFFALAWMQLRFTGIEFPIPFTGLAVNYVFTFIICYILARMFFGRVKNRLPYFRNIHRMLMEYEKSSAPNIT